MHHAAIDSLTVKACGLSCFYLTPVQSPRNQVQLPLNPRGTRFMHVHRNVPGILRRINEVFDEAGANIAGQHLQTAGDIGYVVVEAEIGNGEAQTMLARLRALEGTIRARLLYQRP